ncbi:helix-turn-helix transcriptional regulator [Kitasatospora sp. NPDC048540]|uniref:helix-turn-helix domain-containing protein n=1 Tax=unclassified Kitasatospora TaxID=2633591 RepID=UPI00068B3C85|nr:helix-turn-helix transcriptional regulator [Kitasatospora sp. MBT63]
MSDEIPPGTRDGATLMTFDGVRCVEELGQAIGRRREDLGWSRSKLAEESGMTEMSIARLEEGQAAFTFPLVGRIAAVLGLDLQVALVPRTGASTSGSKS